MTLLLVINALSASAARPGALHFVSFYERLLNQGQRMLHLHFEYLERTHDGYLLTDEHQLMFEAIKSKDVERI